MNKFSRKVVIGIFFTILFFRANASEFKLLIGTQIPLQYHIGANYDFNKRIGLTANFGILTQPYDKAILEVLGAFGTDEVYLNMIQNAFNRGYISDLGVQFYINRKNYLRIFGQYVSLSASDAPKDLLESYYGISFGSGLLAGNNAVNVEMKSSLVQLGLLYGHSFAFKGNNWKINLELGASKNISSNTELYMDSKVLNQASALINGDLSEIYFDYAYIPTLNLALVYTLISK